MFYQELSLLIISTLCSSSLATNFPSYFIPSEIFYLRPETSLTVGHQRPPHPEPDAVLINTGGSTPSGHGPPGRQGPGVFGHPGGPGVFNPFGGPGVYGAPNSPGQFYPPSVPGVYGGPGHFNPPGGPGQFYPPNVPGVYGGPGGPGHFNPYGGPEFRPHNVPGVFNHPGGPGLFNHPDGPRMPVYPQPGGLGREVYRHMQPQQPDFVPMFSVGPSGGGWGYNGYGPQRPNFPGNTQFVPDSGRGSSGRSYPGREVKRGSGREMHDDPNAEMFPLIDTLA